jgi:hypothetical protein
MRQLVLTYARWQQDGAGPFLELAYWIGTNPGTQQPGDDNALRDLNANDRSEWVVFTYISIAKTLLGSLVIVRI